MRTSLQKLSSAEYHFFFFFTFARRCAVVADRFVIFTLAWIVWLVFFYANLGKAWTNSLLIFTLGTVIQQ